VEEVTFFIMSKEDVEVSCYEDEMGGSFEVKANWNAFTKSSNDEKYMGEDEDDVVTIVNLIGT
ncbi:hypothetical protein KI387_027039, partial [Taxus chinensis]